MKNILVFLLIFFSYSCSPNSTKIKPSESIECPPVFFAAEHGNYLKFNKDENITLENLAYKAEINNYAFTKPCFVKNNIYNFSLGVLLIIDPINIISPQISLPIYVASLDSENKIIEMQYFLLDGELDKDSDSQEYIQTEISEILKFKTPSNSFVNNFIIGFMLDKKQKELLN